MRIVFFLLLSSCIAAAQTGATSAPAKPESKSPQPRSARPSATVKQPVALIDTTAGTLTCTLFPDKAPKTVQNFIDLARGAKPWHDARTRQWKRGVPLYTGTIFHRVIPNFMIQGGDPLGTGSGSPGYTFEDELREDLLFDQPGRLAMANSGPNTNGSQFFITEVPTPHLNPCLQEGGCQRGTRTVRQGFGHTIFGQCDDASVELVKQIARMPADPRNNRPEQPVKIEKITILNPPPAPAKRRPVRKPASGGAKTP